MEGTDDVAIPELDTTYVEDTTVFLDSLRVVDDSFWPVRKAGGEEVQIRAGGHFLREPIQTIYPSLSPRNSEATINNSNALWTERDSSVEIPRGYVAKTASLHKKMDDEVLPLLYSEKSREKNNGEKVEEFLKQLVEHPEWARSLTYVKLNAAVPKELQMKLITYAYLNVNSRPKYMTILTKSLDAKDLTHYIKKAFESTEVPLDRTLLRLYCKNAVSGLKPLLRAVILASSGTPSVETEYSDILGEMTYKETSVRMKTGDITTFCKLEELGRCLGIRFLTTFICRSTENPHRTLHIRYYDELKANGSRVIYIQMDHEVFNNCGVRFSSFTGEFPFNVGTEEMAPLSAMHPPIYDLIAIIQKLSPTH